MTQQQYPIHFKADLPKIHYNTTGLTGSKLEVKRQKAKGLAHEILCMFAFNPQVELTAWQVYDKIQGNRPITSVRRAISDLVESGFLSYSGKKVDGPYNEECKTVKLNPNSL